MISGTTTSVEDYFKRVVVHEFGHMLGLAHEHQRPDMPSSPCMDVMRARLVGCPICLSSASPCDAINYNKCFYPRTVTSPTALTISDIDYAQHVAEQTYVFKPTEFVGLTPAEPRSIMSYCSIPDRGDGLPGDGRDPGDDQPAMYDMLGMEMLYPPNVTYPIGCGTGCLRSGAGAIVRTDGAVTSDWIARGAINSTFGATIGGPTGLTSVNAAAFPNGSTPWAYSFTSARGDITLSGGGTVVKSSGLHTAILGAVL